MNGEHSGPINLGNPDIHNPRAGAAGADADQPGSALGGETIAAG